jgi:hypothetical protein
MGQAFTDSEKSRIKHFLSYPDWRLLAQSIQLGFPSASQPMFLLDLAFDKVSPDARDSVRKDLAECECIEEQMSDARSRFKALKVGEITLNPEESSKLRTEMLWWVTRLGDDLGVVPDPYSQMMYAGIRDMGGMNGRVVG